MERNWKQLNTVVILNQDILLSIFSSILHSLIHFHLHLWHMICLNYQQSVARSHMWQLWLYVQYSAWFHLFSWVLRKIGQLSFNWTNTSHWLWLFLSQVVQTVVSTQSKQLLGLIPVCMLCLYLQDLSSGSLASSHSPQSNAPTAGRLATWNHVSRVSSVLSWDWLQPVDGWMDISVWVE